MPGLGPGIHVFAATREIATSILSCRCNDAMSTCISYEDVDGRDKPGHDEKEETR